MRHEQDLVLRHRAERVVRGQGLRAVDVQRGAEAPLAEQLRQSHLVAQRRAGDVHEHGRGPEALEELPADHAPGLFRQQHGEGDNVRPLEDLLQGGLPAADGRRRERRLGPARPAENLTRAESAEELRGPQPDVAEPHDADDLAPELHAAQRVRPAAAAERALGRGELPADGQGEADGELRDRRRGVVRGVHDGDSAPPAGLVVHVVRAHEGDREEPALRVPREDVLGDGAPAIRDDGPGV
mmetsp:Transcript_99048/g.319356  ORF Transcript_99048/g.319356 Transcript_99048/m.319356 type:complete len:241 (-) Transcript_99048:216-938(-)